MKFFSLIYQGDVQLSTKNKKVIRAEDFSTLMQSIEILERAKEDAKHYKKEIEQKCELLKSQAQEEGFLEGLARLNEHIIHFDQQINTLRLNMQNQILPLVLKAAKKIVGEQLRLHPETIVEIVIQTLTPILQNSRITIYVNKADKEILEHERAKIKALLEHVQVLNIQERDDIAPGGCIIETESGIINATIENQWRALELAFERYGKA